jgi:hypothetical protein
MDVTPQKPSPEDENVVSMEEFKARPKPAMKEPPEGPDWLSSIKSGTEFLVRDKFGALTPRFLVLEWIHGGLHPTGNVLLIPAKTPNDTKNWQWVDPIEFCRIYDNRGILWEPEEEDG